jgi:hypothetical protein
MASLDTVPLGSGTVQAISYSTEQGHASTQGLNYFVNLCWEKYTQRLLGSLCPTVFKAVNDPTSLLHQVMSMVARELSGCTELVTYTGSDARGDGAFNIHTRFGPIQGVTSVQRVDAAGTVLETYTALSTDGDKTIAVSGTTPAKAGDFLSVTYTYLHKGLEYAVQEALAQLNILTSSGAFLDKWGQWFNTPRNLTGTYGSELYGGGLYGTPGTEDDTHFSRRIIDRVLQTRDTKAAILGAIQTVTGGSPYIVEWFNPKVPTGFIFNVTGSPAWSGGETEAARAKHLIWGKTARFRGKSSAGGGAYVFEVWVPQGTGYSTAQLLAIVRQYRAAGTRAFIRYIGS